MKLSFLILGIRCLWYCDRQNATYFYQKKICNFIVITEACPFSWYFKITFCQTKNTKWLYIMCQLYSFIHIRTFTIIWVSCNGMQNECRNHFLKYNTKIIRKIHKTAARTFRFFIFFSLFFSWAHARYWRSCHHAPGQKRKKEKWSSITTQQITGLVLLTC